MKKHQFGFYLLLCSLVLSACQLAAPTKVDLPRSRPIASSQPIQEAQQALKDKIKNKPVYNGPIRIGLLPQIVSPELGLSSKDLTPVLEKEGFQVQALPDGPLVFQESFFQSGETQRTIQITQTDDRYTVHVAKQTGNPQVEININGSTWIKDADFKQQEAQNTSLLLNSRNVMRIRVTGEPGDVVTVSLVKGGSAGTILRPQSELHQLDSTQATHLENNNVNRFNPNDPQSLGDLKAYHQDLLLPDANGDNTIRFSGLQANGDRTVRFETGSLVLAFHDPVVGKNIMTNYYGATLIEELDGFYKFQLDLSQSPVTDVINLIRYMNARGEQTITDMNFSSYEALQTFALSLDLFKRFPGLLTSMEFNEIGEPAASFNDSSFEHNTNTTISSEITNVESASQSEMRTINDCNNNAVTIWWLKETKVFEAWDYSIGTGIKVAWLDMGYKFPFADIDDRRLEFGHGDHNITGDNVSGVAKENGDTEASKKYHSLYAMLTGFAERDNNIKTVGVAPNTTLWPYAVYASWDFAKAMKKAREDNVDVIGLNYGWSKAAIMQSILYDLGEFAGFLTGDSVEKQVKEAIKANIPVVMAAHNYKQSLQNWKLVDQYSPNGVNDSAALIGPGNRDSELDNLIVVGNASYYQAPDVTAVPCPATPSPAAVTTPAPPPLAIYAAHIKDSENKNGAGSNYGNALVWAPGAQIFVSYVEDSSKVSRFSGTSAATPFVTATVALMKSRDPSLTPQQIQDILLNKAKGTPVVPHPEMVSAGVQPAYMVDVAKAVKAVANVPKAETYFATLFESGSQKTAIFNKSAQLSANNNGGLEQSKQLMDSVSREVWNALRGDKLVKITGWSDSMPNFKAGDQNLYQRFEVLDAEVICDVNNCTNPSAAFDPKLTSVNATKDAAGDIILELQGENLIADVSGNAQVRILLEHMTLPAGFSNAQEELVFLKSGPSRSGEIVEISNKGDYVKLKIAKDRLDHSLTAPDPAGFKVRTGSYKIAFRNTITKKNSNFIDNSTGFNISSTTSGGGGILIQSDAPVDPPPGHYIFDQIGNRWIRENGRVSVETNTFAGLYFTEPIRQLTVKVGPVELPVVSVLKDLAVLGIPEDLPAGVHELTVEVDGKTLTLKDAIEKITPAVQPTSEPSPPPSSSPIINKSLRVYNVEGNDEARVYLNGVLVARANQGEEIEVNFSYDTDHRFSHTRPNEVIFEYENRGGGYALGFELKNGSNPAFFHEQGKAGIQNVINQDQSEDQRQGIVFRERMLLHQFNYPVGSGEAWLKLYNTDDEEFTMFATGNLGDPLWGTGLRAIPGPNEEWAKRLPYPDRFFPCEGYISRYEEDDCYGGGSSLDLPSISLANPAGTYSYGIEMYRGINKVFHYVVGQPNGYGAKDNSMASNEYSILSTGYPIYNHNPFTDPWWLNYDSD